jgi:hypothetical protein
MYFTSQIRNIVIYNDFSLKLGYYPNDDRKSSDIRDVTLSLFSNKGQSLLCLTLLSQNHWK